MCDRALDDSVALPIDPDAILEDLDRRVQLAAPHLYVASVGPKRLDSRFNHLLAEAMRADDRAKIQVVVPRDQRLVSHRAETGALAQKEHHTLRIENALRFPQQALGICKVHRRPGSLQMLHQRCVLGVGECQAAPPNRRAVTAATRRSAPKDALSGDCGTISGRQAKLRLVSPAIAERHAPGLTRAGHRAEGSAPRSSGTVRSNGPVWPPGR